MLTGCKLAGNWPTTAWLPRGASSSAATERSEGDAGATTAARELGNHSQLALKTIEHWPFPEAFTLGPEACEEAYAPYHKYLTRFVEVATRAKELNAVRDLIVTGAHQEDGRIEVQCHGFAWQPEDFDDYRVARIRNSSLQNHWVDPGVGVPLVVVRHSQDHDPNLGSTAPFAATAILRPPTKSEQAAAKQVSPGQPPLIGILNLHNPLQGKTVELAGRSVPLARDLTAPFVVAKHEIPHHAKLNFLWPGRNDEGAGLKMIEPYQPGKIPVIFVHGLLSDKFTWADVVNDLRAVPGIL